VPTPSSCSASLLFLLHAIYRLETPSQSPTLIQIRTARIVMLLAELSRPFFVKVEEYLVKSTSFEIRTDGSHLTADRFSRERRTTFHEQWTPSQRAAWRRGIIKKRLRPSSPLQGAHAGQTRSRFPTILHPPTSCRSFTSNDNFP